MTRSARAELDRQIDTLLSRDVPALVGLGAAAFDALLDPLRHLADGLPDLPAPAAGRAPLVLVLTRAVLAPEQALPLLRLAPGGRKPGVLDRNHEPGSLAGYEPIREVDLPDHPAYLLLDIDRGAEFRSVRPEDALPVILGRGRTPLTIDEGVSATLHAPELLEANHCFMLSGSRRGDRRVPAMWISARAPKLGWCWDGNPHTWLGVASCGVRVGPH